ncbi:hypothetical protein [Dyadobacter sediminis]|uniref:Alpha-amylase/branching enzyme C-terminal all beta domain-containing protein n=1 Tax=Dyadobacter sediminis TaxID=1493691 RepID=A0A5R9KCE6_9BACT|nr:hypothetical protein [Dyadobacter sediminis]TLU92409.1 hypothetical protein FEM55_16950 [Dyadobacter sediminis]
MIQLPFAAESSPDFPRIPETVSMAMRNWILTFSRKIPEVEKLNMLFRQNAGWNSGQQFLRSTSDNGIDFQFPGLRNNAADAVVAWSVIHNEKEILFAVNLNPEKEAVAYVTIDVALHAVDSRMRNRYASATCPAELNVEVRNGKAIRLTIPAYGFVIYE